MTMKTLIVAACLLSGVMALPAGAVEQKTKVETKREYKTRVKGRHYKRTAHTKTKVKRTVER